MTTFKTYTPDNRKPKDNEEDKLQSSCFAFWNKFFRKESVLFSVPNGQQRNYAEVSIALATGLTAGVADLILLLSDGRAVFLELKTVTGTQKKRQEAFQQSVERLGFKYHIVRTLEHFKSLLFTYIHPIDEDSDQETAPKKANVPGTGSRKQGAKGQASNPEKAVRRATASR